MSPMSCNNPEHDDFDNLFVLLAEKDAEIERLRAVVADESEPYFRSDYEARVKAGTNGPDLWPYPRSCT